MVLSFMARMSDGTLKGGSTLTSCTALGGCPSVASAADQISQVNKNILYEKVGGINM